jgi:hypothetical protein
MTTTQTRTAATVVITLIIVGLLIATPLGAYIVNDLLTPVLDSLGAMFTWLFADTIGSAIYTIGGLLGELGELF